MTPIEGKPPSHLAHAIKIRHVNESPLGATKVHVLSWNGVLNCIKERLGRRGGATIGPQLLNGHKSTDKSHSFGVHVHIFTPVHSVTFVRMSSNYRYTCIVSMNMKMSRVGVVHISHVQHSKVNFWERAIKSHFLPHPIPFQRNNVKTK